MIDEASINASIVRTAERLIAGPSGDERDNQLAEIASLMAALSSVCQRVTLDHDLGIAAKELGHRCLQAIYEST